MATEPTVLGGWVTTGLVVGAIGIAFSQIDKLTTNSQKARLQAIAKRWVPFFNRIKPRRIPAEALQLIGERADAVSLFCGVCWLLSAIFLALTHFDVGPFGPFVALSQRLALLATVAWMGAGYLAILSDELNGPGLFISGAALMLGLGGVLAALLPAVYGGDIVLPLAIAAGALPFLLIVAFFYVAWATFWAVRLVGRQFATLSSEKDTFFAHIGVLAGLVAGVIERAVKLL